MPDLTFLPLSLVSLMSSLGQREARGEDSLGNIVRTGQAPGPQLRAENGSGVRACVCRRR